jgi:hypothetical protein
MSFCLFIAQKYKFKNSASVRNVTELDILHINKIGKCLYLHHIVLNNTTPNKNKNQNEIQKNTSKIKW